jgi:hypothetical protein
MSDIVSGQAKAWHTDVIDIARLAGAHRSRLDRQRCRTDHPVGIDPGAPGKGFEVREGPLSRAVVTRD